MERIVPLETDIRPDAAVSGAALLSDEYRTTLLFNAKRRGQDNRYHDAGLAVVRFQRCIISRFGYPNDEAWLGIPRTRGLGYGCYEVFDSNWANELCELNKYSFPNRELWTREHGRHFLFLFHDSSFECIASAYAIEIVGTDRFEAIALEFIKGLSER